MKTIKIIYWISTILIAGVMTMSATLQLIQGQAVIDSLKHLGLPVQITILLGILKAMGVIALIVPGYPKIREWAYAGFSFLLIGATFLHFSIGDYQPTTIVLFGILITSYALGNKIKQSKTVSIA